MESAFDIAVYRLLLACHARALDRAAGRIQNGSVNVVGFARADRER
jgi:hypothetical protein